MAWFRPMGAAEVAYHQETVVGRGDDHPGRALAYYGTRGETPLRWRGAGAARHGLDGEVTSDAYEVVFGEGGFRDPRSGTRLVTSTRPGFELVVGAHKTVAVLGVAGEPDAMHSILDVETATTMDWLDDWFQASGGRRGRDQVRTATGGLTYCVTRHATSRAGDPAPHDHVLVANVVEMFDERGGWKALDSAALRDTVEAATMVGRLHSAARAVELGFEIAPDHGPSGNLRHWRIVGVPDDVCEVFSKRSDEIAEYLAATGQDGYRARSVAARQTRKVKRHTPVDELMTGWHAELATLGWPLERLAAHLDRARQHSPRLSFGLTDTEVDQLAADALDINGGLLTRHKVFTRTHLVAEVAPRLYGRDPADLDRVIDRIVASRDVVPLIRVAGAREQTYTTADVLAAEHTIAASVTRLAGQPGAAVHPRQVAAAIEDKEHSIGRPLNAGQSAAVAAMCDPQQAVTVVIGVAGSGKTTAVDAAAGALESSGYRVVGTSTSGQAARNLGAEARIDARTFASLLWRLDHQQITLDDRTVVVVDEAGMAADADLARLVLAIERSHAKLVLVGDHHQLAAVGPGGALARLAERRPALAVVLDQNVRQHDPAERTALAELRHGSVPAAVAWYSDNDRISTAPTRTDTLVATADAWAYDTADGHDTALLAWRRADVADLNRLARQRWDQLGQLAGPDVTVKGGRTYAVGDRIVALAPNPEVGIVTSEQLTIVDLDHDRITAQAADGKPVTLTGRAIDNDHLDHAYALTVHRSQGATYDRAHVVAAGGGRELAYVALSRARDHTTIHATADTIEQAVDDLQADWGVERHQRWITDSPAQVGHHPEPIPAVSDPPAVGVGQYALHQRLADLHADHQDLHHGTGRWERTPAGEAARRRRATRAELDAAQRQATSPTARRRHRRAAARTIPDLTAANSHAEAHWQHVGQPIADRIADAIRAAQLEVDRLEANEFRARLPAPSAPRLGLLAQRQPDLARPAVEDGLGL